MSAYGVTDFVEAKVHEAHGRQTRREISRLSSGQIADGRIFPLAELHAFADSDLMASATEARRAAVKRFMEERGLKPKPWAQKAGLAESVVRTYLSGRTNSLTSSTLEKLARAADATIAEIIGEKPKEPRMPRDVVAIKGLKVSASMGGGVEVSEESEGEPFYFRSEWLEKRLGTRNALLRVIGLEGDSMEPTLHDGDVALVHVHGGDLAHEPGVYCLWDGSGLMVKRLQLLPGGRLQVLSDNRLYDPYEVPVDAVRIIGRVIWRAGDV